MLKPLLFMIKRAYLLRHKDIMTELFCLALLSCCGEQNEGSY